MSNNNNNNNNNDDGPLLESKHLMKGQDIQNGLKIKSNNVNNEPPNIPYPKRVFFIIGTRFCERLNYCGVSTILVLYLKNKLGYSENDATVLYHGFMMTVFFMCLFGGIISDVWLGKFKTILCFAFIYMIGSTMVVMSSIPFQNLPPNTILIVGLTLIAIGGGSIKPCIAAFGGDQFKMPEQASGVARYFSFYYFATCLGVLISNTVTPILREDVKCFGNEDCFPLAFGVPAILMFASIIFLLAGKSSYTYVKTNPENMLMQVLKCVMNAISTKIREGRTNPHKKLLDYSIDKYGKKLVNDTRILLQILVLYLPLPLFWALYDQLGSRWKFQANRMNGDVGFYTIKPDQMQVVNALLVLIFIPLFEAVVYPLLYKIGIRRPLQKMVIGGFMTAIAFLLSALVQLKIESSPDKAMNMLWLLPQYVTISVGETMFSATGYAFSYEQAPDQMKSVVQALWQLTDAFGNLLLLSVAESAVFNSQAHEFFLFSSLMFIGMVIFMILAYNFKSNIPNQIDLNDKNNLDLEQYIPLKKIEENV